MLFAHPALGLGLDAFVSQTRSLRGGIGRLTGGEGRPEAEEAD
jgi:hypothetical protein